MFENIIIEFVIIQLGSFAILVITVSTLCYCIVVRFPLLSQIFVSRKAPFVQAPSRQDVESEHNPIPDQQIVRCEQRIQYYQQKVRVLEQKVTFWVEQYRQAIIMSERQIYSNAPEIQEAESLETARKASRMEDDLLKDLSILAIWPEQPGLNLKASGDALYNSGVSYIALTDLITAADVIDEFSRGEFTALEIGTHGKQLELTHRGLNGGVMLSDGVASPGWWSRLIAFRKLKLAVVLACDSVQTGEAMLNAGVEKVVVVKGLIQDDEAVKFSLLFYKYIAAGRSIESAFNLARLALTREQGDRLRLLSTKHI